MKLRTTVLALMFLVVTAVSSFAQRPISVVAGAGFNKFTVSDDEPSDNKTGLVIGVAFTAYAKNRVSLVPEILFAQKGASFNDNSDDFSFSLGYLDVPILVRFALASGTTVPFLTVGPTIGVRVSASIDPEDAAFDAGENFSRSDMGFAVGGGVRAKSVSFQVRFQQSLMNILSDTGASNFEESGSVHNRTITVLVGFGG